AAFRSDAPRRHFQVRISPLLPALRFPALRERFHQRLHLRGLVGRVAMMARCPPSSPTHFPYCSSTISTEVPQDRATHLRFACLLTAAEMPLCRLHFRGPTPAAWTAG